MNPERIPPMEKDYYWDKQDCPIPYTEASMHFKKKTYPGSAAEMKLIERISSPDIVSTPRPLPIASPRKVAVKKLNSLPNGGSCRSVDSPDILKDPMHKSSSSKF
jgi:hypothetical protein